MRNYPGIPSRFRRAATRCGAPRNRQECLFYISSNKNVCSTYRAGIAASGCQRSGRSVFSYYLQSSNCGGPIFYFRQLYIWSVLLGLTGK
jgi:hypothetical protein